MSVTAQDEAVVRNPTPAVMCSPTGNALAVPSSSTVIGTYPDDGGGQRLGARCDEEHCEERDRKLREDTMVLHDPSPSRG